MSKVKKDYLLAIKLSDGNVIIGFPDKRRRQKFIDEVLLYSFCPYALAEGEVIKDESKKANNNKNVRRVNRKAKSRGTKSKH